MIKRIFLFIIFISFYMNHTSAQHADFRFMIEQAIKAPSGHNTQPWLFKMNEKNIEIHPNFEKALPIVDFDNRELFISLGCATENLCIAASQRGYGTYIKIETKGIINIELTKDESVVPDPLYDQMTHRQTNRSMYSGRIIPIDTLKILQETPGNLSGINIYTYQNGTPEFDSISTYVARGNDIQMRDKAFKDELHTWMRYNKKHQDENNDGLSYAVFGAPNLPLFIVKPMMKKAINEKSQNKGDKKKMRSSSHFVLFTGERNTVEEWINLGRMLQRFLLKSTELGIAHAYMNQPNEIRELSVELQKSLRLSEEYPMILIRIGYGEKMPYSKRKNIEEVIIP